MTKLPAENNTRLVKNISMKLDNYFHITNTNNVQVSKRIYIEIPEEITNQLNLNHQPSTASHSMRDNFIFNEEKMILQEWGGSIENVLNCDVCIIIDPGKN